MVGAVVFSVGELNLDDILCVHRIKGRCLACWVIVVELLQGATWPLPPHRGGLPHGTINDVIGDHPNPLGTSWASHFEAKPILFAASVVALMYAYALLS